MLKIEFTKEMKRNAKLMKKRGKNMSKLSEVLELLASGRPVPKKIQRSSAYGILKRFSGMPHRT